MATTKEKILISLNVRGIFLCILALSCLKTFGAEESTQLFKLGKNSYNQSQLSPASQQAIYEAKLNAYENILNVIDDYLIDKKYQDDAKKQNKTKSQIKREEWEKVQVTPAEIKTWYDKNKHRLGGRDIKSISHEIKHHLKNEKMKQVRKALLKNIKEGGKFSIQIQPPKAPSFKISSNGYPFKGAPNAKVTIIEFADYQCPHCKQASTQLKRIVEKYKSKIKLIYLDYPINRSGISKKMAIGAYCANAQNKFWEYHHMTFDNQEKLTHESVSQHAKTLNLNMNKFEK